MDKNDDDSNWREEYRGMKVLTKYQVDLLENGPKSLAQAWMFQVLKFKYGRFEK